MARTIDEIERHAFITGDVRTCQLIQLIEDNLSGVDELEDLRTDNEHLEARVAELRSELDETAAEAERLRQALVKLLGECNWEREGHTAGTKAAVKALDQ